MSRAPACLRLPWIGHLPEPLAVIEARGKREDPPQRIRHPHPVRLPRVVVRVVAQQVAVLVVVLPHPAADALLVRSFLHLAAALPAALVDAVALAVGGLAPLGGVLDARIVAGAAAERRARRAAVG